MGQDSNYQLDTMKWTMLRTPLGRGTKESKYQSPLSYLPTHYLI